MLYSLTKNRHMGLLAMKKLSNLNSFAWSNFSMKLIYEAEIFGQLVVISFIGIICYQQLKYGPK